MSWWNPVDDVKAAAKDVTHVASDVVKTGENLASDAYETAKTAVKGAIKVGTDVVQTTEKVGSDVVQGHFGDALKDTGKGIVQTGEDAVKSTVDTAGAYVHTVTDLGKNVWHTAGDVNQLMLDSVSAVNPVLGAGLRLGEVFTESVINTAVLQPIDGLEQLAGAGIHALTGYDLPKLDLHLTPDTQGLGWAGKVAEYAGDGAGFIAPLLLTGGATSALAGLAIAGKVGEAAEVASVAGRVGEAAEGASTLSKAADVADVTSKGAEAAGVTSRAADAAGVTSKAADVAEAANPADKVAQTASLSERASAKVSSGAQRFIDSRYKTAVDGAISGFLFTPSNGNGNILTQRLHAAEVNGLTFGVMGAASRGLTGAADAALNATVGDAATKTGVQIAKRVGVNAVSGVAGGVTNAETSSVLDGKGFASAGDVGKSALEFAATGAAMDGAHLAYARDSVSAPQPEVSQSETFDATPPAPQADWSTPTMNRFSTFDAAPPMEAPASAPVNAPAETAITAPADMPTPAPAETATTVPADMPTAAPTDTPSYENLIASLRAQHMTPGDIAQSVNDSNLLGAGMANRVYSIDGLDGYVARIPHTVDASNSQGADLRPVDDYWKEANLGQPVAQLGDIQILKKVDGDAIKAKSNDQSNLLSRLKEKIARETPTQRHARQERIIAAMPQSSYDELAQKMLGLQARGKHFDAVNPSNVLVSQDGFNPVDVGDEPIRIAGRNGAIDGRSAGFGLYEMLRPLTGTGINDWVPRDSGKLRESYQQIIEKSVTAAQRSGLSIVPDPRLQQMFDAVGMSKQYADLVSNRSEDQGLQHILRQSGYYG